MKTYFWIKIFQCISIIIIIVLASSIWIAPYNYVYGKGQILVCNSTDSILNYANKWDNMKNMPLEAYKKNVNYDKELYSKQNHKLDSIDLALITKSVQDCLYVDSAKINLKFLEDMRKNGQLLTSDEFASRISSYYNTLVGVLGAMFILFSLTTYFTIRQNFEKKFDEKRDEIDNKVSISEKSILKKQEEIENSLRNKIRTELKEMLRDSRQVRIDFTSSITGDLEGHFLTQDDADKINEIIEAINNKQKDLISEVAELQEMAAYNESIVEKYAGNNSLRSKRRQKNGNKRNKKA